MNYEIVKSVHYQSHLSFDWAVSKLSPTLVNICMHTFVCSFYMKLLFKKCNDIKLNIVTC